MGLIHVDDIKTGMVLRDDIRDHNGRFLLGKGVTIQDKHLRIFRIWGISQADIQGTAEHSHQHFPDHGSKALQQARAGIIKRFPVKDPDSRLYKALVDLFAFHACIEPDRKTDFPFFDTDQVAGFTDRVPNDKLTDPESKLGEDVNLSSLPEIFFLIQEAIKDPRTSSRHIANIISKDQALAAKLLRLVNSPFYGFPSRIETVSRAVTILGTRQLSSLALGLSAFSRFRCISPDILDMESFWKHSIACAIGAKILAGYCNYPNSEIFFVCGLLHDIGRLVMLNYYPEEYFQVLISARKKRIRLASAEKMYFRYDHATLGARLAKRWKLPLRIEESIRHHETPNRSRYPAEATLVHMASIMAIGCRIGSSGEALIPVPDEQSWHSIRLDCSILNQVARLTKAQVDNIYRLLFA